MYLDLCSYALHSLYWHSLVQNDPRKGISINHGSMGTVGIDGKH